MSNVELLELKNCSDLQLGSDVDSAQQNQGVSS